MREEQHSKEQSFDRRTSFFQSEVFDWIKTVVITLVLVGILKSQVIIMAKVPSGSMLDTIQLEERLMGNRLAYIKEDPKRGDIVIFDAPDEKGKLYIKRIIGLPGETVTIKDGEIYIDDAVEPLEEDYLRKEPWVVDNDGFEFEVPEDSYLMLGDNRNDSKDARYWEHTYVSRDTIVAKAVFVWYPFTEIRRLK